MKTADLRKLAEKEKIKDWEEMEREDLINALGGEEEEKDEENEEEEEEEENLEDFTVLELKELAEEKEIELKPKMKKVDIIKAIKKGKKKEEKEEEGLKKEQEKEEGTKVTGMGIKEEHVPVGSKSAKMKARLAKQQKVRILIPLEGKEKIGATESVILNGSRLNILKGIYVDVPEQVADVLEDSLKQTVRAMGHALKIEQQLHSAPKP